MQRFIALGLALALAGCAGRRITLPTDAGAPLPDVGVVHETVTAACAGVRTFTAELTLTGRVGDDRLRGRVIAGFARPASMRLEGVAPFGPPAFILTARDDVATLLLPRDSRVVRDASAAAILGALTGVALAPEDLQAIVTGCVVPVSRPSGGRLHANGWASIDLDGGGTLYLQRRSGVWTVRAARRDGWQVEYQVWQSRFPQAIRLRSEAQAVQVDLTASIGQIEANVDIAPTAFAVDVPSGARPLTVDELREAGPLQR